MNLYSEVSQSHHCDRFDKTVRKGDYPCGECRFYVLRSGQRNNNVPDSIRT